MAKVSLTDGDCIATIATQHQYVWRTLWTHPDNKVLHDRRQNPNSLLPSEGYAPPTFPARLDPEELAALDPLIYGTDASESGDKVDVPNKREKDEPAATDQLHTYRVARNHVRLKLKIMENGTPVRNAPYELQLTGNPLDGAERTRKAYKLIADRTDGDGNIERDITVHAMTGELTIFDSLTGTLPLYRYHLMLGWLHPFNTISGLQARLQNLGFYLDPVINGEMNPALRNALRAFRLSQSKGAVRASDRIDAAVLAAVRDAHDGAR